MLWNCPECGGNLSSTAVICPHCGFTVDEHRDEVRAHNERLRADVKEQDARHTQRKARDKRVERAVILAVVFLGLPALVVFLAVRPTPPPPSTPEVHQPERPPDYSISAKALCTMVVEDRLKAPASADFSSDLARKVSPHSDEYVWHGHVDAQNGFGAQIRTSIRCKVRCTSTTDCQVVSLDM